ncbi:hypothetical protein T07_4731 [Trichinella nelsoni]|uniref:Uncharacterized protein n=1 Tax=Trichinella nelsoni TaxID=6336 RepID=A0A0V0SD12_9BILA|nr:hypothetical protein T07_4731 [Trichinella nelsoni]
MNSAIRVKDLKLFHGIIFAYSYQQDPDCKLVADNQELELYCHSCYQKTDKNKSYASNDNFRHSNFI